VLRVGGSGEVHSKGRTARLGVDCTVVLPVDRHHQIFNVGPQPPEILGAFAATPVVTLQPDGVALELPWRS